MIEPLNQTVTIPLWLLFILLAYSEQRIAKVVGGLRQLRPRRDRRGDLDDESDPDTNR